MATFTLETLRIGPKNQLSGSDSLYDAFYKIKNNFSILANANFSGSLNAGVGINLATNALTGVVTITNSGVTELIAGNGISLSGSNGAVIITNNGPGSGTVTSVGATSTTLAISNTPITSSGNITIEMPELIGGGSFSFANITVDPYGRITAISNGVVTAGTVTSVGVTSTALTVSNSPITSSGNIIVDMPEVIGGGTFSFANITVDIYGRVTSASNGNINGSNLSSNNFTANTVTANNTVTIGDSRIGWATITTTSTANAAIATIPVEDWTGFKFFVKGHDTVGGNRFVGTIDVLTDGSNVEVDEYGGMSFGADMGDVWVDISGGSILLMTTPSSANSTVWTTQYTLI